MNCPLLYEINTRCWLAELSAAAGRRVTLGNVPDSEFEFWRRCGFTHIWLMGVWTLGERGRAWSRRCLANENDAGKEGRNVEGGNTDALNGALRRADIAGSPYAICGYDVSRRIGGTEALQKFRRKLNERGLKLVLDFIPNHTALDHPWVREHPEYYVTSAARGEGMTRPYRGAPRWFAHGACGHGAPWVDTLQLDYRNQSLRKAMVAELLKVAEQCDGVRCDMAMLALNDVIARLWGNLQPPNAERDGEFWSTAISATKNRWKDFLFLAEVYWDLEPRLQELGFDFTYDKLLYDRLVAHDGHGAVQYLAARKPDFISRSAHFLENHDEPRIASLLSPEEQRAAAVLIAALPGMRLFHEGQLSGVRAHANVHFHRRVAEAPDDELARFYERLFSVLKESRVGQGTPALLSGRPAWEGNPTHENFALVQWTGRDGSFDLVAINLAAHPSQCFVKPTVSASEGGTWSFRDLLGDEELQRTDAELTERGLYLDVPAHRAQVFRCERQGYAGLHLEIKGQKSAKFSAE